MCIMRSIQNKRAVLTGAASGIGRELALQLAEHKAVLCLVDRHQAGLEETAEQCRARGITAHTLVADLVDEQASSWTLEWPATHSFSPLFVLLPSEVSDAATSEVVMPDSV